jgi:3',5'-cyclic AMP phosphodiesterase CpdA
MKNHIVVQVSDSHLGPFASEYVANWDIVVDHLGKSKPDLVVHSGDVACNDPQDRAEQDFAFRHAARLPQPWIAIPGNHDIGDGPPDPVFQQHVTPANCGDFRHRYGADCWSRDLGDWTLIGINALLFGTGFADEDTQWRWLVEQVTRARRPIAIFMHKPPFLVSFDEETESSLTIPAAVRARLRSLVTDSNVRLIACGHTHEYREYALGALKVVWAPSTAFILLQKIGQPRAGDLKELGFIEHCFSGTLHSHRLVQPAGLTLYDNAFHAQLRKQAGVA